MILNLYNVLNIKRELSERYNSVKLRKELVKTVIMAIRNTKK